MGRRILFLGPPGVGKGTQAQLLTKALGVPHISSGEMLREALAAGTELGKQAEAFMEVGDLVPDDLVVAMIGKRLERDDAACGYVLDGFPRNVDQAKALSEAIGADAIDTTLYVDVDEEEIVERLLKRAAVEDRCDDNEETIRHRLEVFHAATEPLVAYYGDCVRKVDGLGAIDAVFCRVINELAH
ncbi:MAG: adenylate kinase [Actinomycetota bacterium]